LFLGCSTAQFECAKKPETTNKQTNKKNKKNKQINATETKQKQNTAILLGGAESHEQHSVARVNKYIKSNKIRGNRTKATKSVSLSNVCKKCILATFSLRGFSPPAFPFSFSIGGMLKDMPKEKGRNRGETEHLK